MRKMLFTLLAAVTLAACNDDSVRPTDDESLLLLDDAAVLAYGAMDMAHPGSHYIARLHRLPDHLKLTTEQQSLIRALLQAFAETTKADREALAAVMQRARAAIQAGQSRDEVRAILAEGDPIRRRLHEAEQNLHSQIEAVLTAEQKAWLAANGPARCRDFALTEPQKTEITGLIAAFNQANLGDIETVRQTFQAARAAHQNGASREEIRAILEGAAAAMHRLAIAHFELQASIHDVLTPDQRASGCYGPRLVIRRIA
jgi:Spy/CpxP family protein refolding chaperone